MRGLIVSLALLAPACATDDVTPGAPDPVDAAPGAAVTPVPSVVAAITLPTDPASASVLGLDLDAPAGDGVDNQLGLALAALSARAPGLALQPAADAGLLRGSFYWLLDWRETAAGTSLLGRAGRAAQPAPCLAPADLATCGRHLAGDGVFELASAPFEDVVIGALRDGRFDGGPGRLDVPLGLGGDVGRWIPLHEVRVRLELTADGRRAHGVVAGAITEADVDALLVPGMAADARAATYRDCQARTPPTPGCGCAPGSRGEAMIALFDGGADACAIREDEVAAVLRELAPPDLDLDHDGRADALSIGIGVDTVAAAFPRL